MMDARVKFKGLRMALVMVALLTGSAGADCPTADLTGDCRVDLEDVAILSRQWLLSYNTEDLTLINAQWMEAPEGPAGIVFVAIPAGTFQMGDNFSEAEIVERPVHTVTLSSFQMSKHEITNAQFAQFLNAAQAQGLIKEVSGRIYASTDSSNSQPWCDTSTSSSDSQIVSIGGGYSVRTRDGKPQDNHPVVCVSWYGAKAFCDFYGYQLPTEAQWEYAARGGLSGRRFPWGADITHNLANYWSSTGYNSYDTSATRGFHPTYNTGGWPYTAPVGSFPANGYGLCDMSGNVWEWCSDWYGSSYYSSSPASNPTGPTRGDYYMLRVLRGGGWDGLADYCRVARRGRNDPDARDYFSGFRVSRP